MPPLVSVVMSVHNGEAYLRKSIQSILDQTFNDFEFIIIDDGSTDGTQNILNSFKDKRVFLISQNNLGLTTSLNKGIALAKGKYVARQDADDISKPDRLEKQVAFMEENPAVGLLGTRFECIDDKDGVTRAALLPLEDIDIRKKLIFTNQFCHSSVMIRKGVLGQTGVFRDFFRYAQDYDLWLRIADKSEIRNLPDFLVYYREIEEAISSQRILLQSLYAGVAANMARQRATINTDDIEQGIVPNLPPAYQLSNNLLKKLTTYYSTNPQKLSDGLHLEAHKTDLCFILKLLCHDLGASKSNFLKTDPDLEQFCLARLRANSSICPVNPIISVVICTYNRADFLPKAIQSLLDQTLPKSDFEVIIVDNASTDSTKSVYDSFSFYPNLHYVYEPEPGLSKARNRGLAESKGRYVAFLDDDAIASQQWLEILIHSFERTHPAPASVGGKILPIWEIPKPDWLPDDMIRCLTVLDYGEQPHYIEYPRILYGTNMAFDREALLNIGGFRTDIGRIKSSLLSCEEADIYRKFYQKGMPVYYVPEASVEHFVPKSRLTRKWHYSRYYWQGRSEVLLHSDTYSFIIIINEIVSSFKAIRQDTVMLLTAKESSSLHGIDFRSRVSIHKNIGRIKQLILTIPTSLEFRRKRSCHGNK